MVEGAIVATTIELAKIRKFYPEIYESVKTRLRTVTLTTGNSGVASSSSLKSTVSSYKNGFTNARHTIYTHELAHVIHFSMDRVKKYGEFTQSIESNYRAGNGFITDYSRTDEYEYFAESAEAFLSLDQHDELKRVSPVMYELCDKLFYRPTSEEVKNYLSSLPGTMALASLSTAN
jgi:hypothetical protein